MFSLFILGNLEKNLFMPASPKALEILSKSLGESPIKTFRKIISLGTKQKVGLQLLCSNCQLHYHCLNFSTSSKVVHILGALDKNLAKIFTKGFTKMKEYYQSVQGIIVSYQYGQPATIDFILFFIKIVKYSKNPNIKKSLI